MPKRMQAYQKIHVLKTERDRIRLNRFEEAQEGIQLTIVRKRSMSDEIDPASSICNIQVEAVYEHVVVATFLNDTTDKAFRVGDSVRHAIYR